ncbi:hypothetical protein WOSG25_290090 [Weissella oryzae SG25]|uniref:Uncharacterized protein n=1 Tax=Weissella oryzae (strain DSM 25784 / JCM 18191 / LMG 30913 / SG25) TaxID=1329250 RepID=A0A069CW88_WEIOS|nr:hypothetical protein [Weissella oryzae]GAK32075.1 hypothetical protein WOSG25_290090 [Weissella oryzae SG25]
MNKYYYIIRKSDGKYWQQAYKPSGKRIMTWTDDEKLAWRAHSEHLKRDFVRELVKEGVLAMEDAKYNGLEEVYFEDVDRRDY